MTLENKLVTKRYQRKRNMKFESVKGLVFNIFIKNKRIETMINYILMGIIPLKTVNNV